MTAGATAAPPDPLGWAREGRDLVPGVPARVGQLADQLDAMSDGLGSTDRLVRQVAGDGWRGQAARGFARLMASLPAPYARAAPELREAAHAVRRHAAVLAAAQQQAEEALLLGRRATALRSTAGAAPGATGESAAADALQRRALEQVGSARARVRGSGLAAAAALDRAGAAAPQEPNVVVRMLHRAVSFTHGVQVGVAESLVGTARTAAALSLNRAVVDPSGWWRDVRALEQALGTAVTHPVATARAVVNPELLASDPGRWVGQLLPDVLLGMATGGTGLVANRGVSVGVRLAELARRGERLDDLRAGIEVATAGGRSRVRLRDARGWRHVDDSGALRTLTPGQHMATLALRRDAQWAEHDLRTRVVAVGRATSSELMGLEHAVKGGVSLRRKVSDGVGTQPLGEVLPGVNDTVRYTFVPSHGAYGAAVPGIIAGLRTQGMVLVKAKNFWGGARYRGLNLTLADPRTGRLLEVQAHTPGSWAATKATHDDYEKWRLLPDGDPAKAVLAARIARVFAHVPEPPGLRHLTDYLRTLPTAPATNRPPELQSLQVAPRAVAVGVAAGAASAGAEGRTQPPGGAGDPSLSCGDGRRAGRTIEHGNARRPDGGPS